jgi:cytochrome c553
MSQVSRLTRPGRRGSAIYMFRIWLLIACLAACGKGDKPPPPQGVTGLAQETGPQRPPSGSAAVQPGHDQPSEAERIFMTQCARCHGMDGRGTGEVAATLEPKPRDYTDAAWQASVSDEELRQIIVQGGQALGKSVMMPPNPGLKNRPEVVDELVRIIRNFGKPK